MADAGLDWHAELAMYFDYDSGPAVVGHMNFVLLRTGCGDLEIALSEADNDDADELMPLVDGDDFGSGVYEQFGTGVGSTALAIVNMVLHPGVRGRGLAPWMIGEVLHRMLPEGMVVARAQEADNPSLPMDFLTAECLRECGLDPLAAHSHFFGQSTASGELARARSRNAIDRELSIEISGTAADW